MADLIVKQGRSGNWAVFKPGEDFPESGWFPSKSGAQAELKRRGGVSTKSVSKRDKVVYPTIFGYRWEDIDDLQHGRITSSQLGRRGNDATWTSPASRQLSADLAPLKAALKAARERSEKSFKEWKLLKAERAKVDPKDRGRMDTINRRMDELTAEMDKADAEWREANLAWTKRMNRGADSADDLRARMHRALDRAIDHARRRAKDISPMLQRLQATISQIPSDSEFQSGEWRCRITRGGQFNSSTVWPTRQRAEEYARKKKADIVPSIKVASDRRARDAGWSIPELKRVLAEAEKANKQSPTAETAAKVRAARMALQVARAADDKPIMLRMNGIIRREEKRAPTADERRRLTQYVENQKNV
jgi:hypothetical protein